MKLRRLVWNGLAGIGVLILLICFTPLPEMMTRPLVLSQEGKNHQTVVVLSSGVFDSGLPDFQTLTRMLKGLELFRSGAAKQILCLGGMKTGSGKSYAECMADVFLQWGVPRDALLVHDIGGHTARDLDTLLATNHTGFSAQDAMYVTSAYHSLRLRLLLDKRNIGAPVVSAWPVELHPETWAARLVTFKCVMREYCVLTGSKIMGWI